MEHAIFNQISTRQDINWDASEVKQLTDHLAPNTLAFCLTFINESGLSSMKADKKTSIDEFNAESWGSSNFHKKIDRLVVGSSSS